jgi:hypothetical protein
MSASDARYSQPIEPTSRDVGGPVIRVGFGCNGQPAYIFHDERRREIRQSCTPENSAVEKPRGFFRAMAKLFGGFQ